MNKAVVIGIVIAIAISVAIIAAVTTEENPTVINNSVENQGDVPENPGKNLKIELREGIGVEGNP